ncbi:DUF2835 family protein [Pseudoalteromonas denitrificans]|uniref:DUF2835 domain-containing protein n=1 Tax=Pseudoalteromonas denitrificans DSM 6059 TaxID=1123010 RepID=A0A1I1G935_9GAMM|nr:DUF2835 family protein [Pseudoalteromonas denitrificans]SFC08237.1 Protein of unknown function [Pseudoalteromonas denitrificans DSM 6059]
MKQFLFYLDLNYEQCEQIYTGKVKSVQVTSQLGKKIRIPAHRFRSFITPSGIKEQFKLCLTENNRFISLEKLF